MKYYSIWCDYVHMYISSQLFYGALAMVERLIPENSANSADQIVVNIYSHSTDVTAQTKMYTIL